MKRFILLVLFIFCLADDSEKKHLEQLILQKKMQYGKIYQNWQVSTLQGNKVQADQLEEYLMQLHKEIESMNSLYLEMNNANFAKKDDVNYEFSIPAIKFADIFGYDKLKKDLKKMFFVANDNVQKSLGLKNNHMKGVLFYGPPGCGKTHFITALAGELGAYLMVVSPNFGNNYINSGHNAVQTLRKKIKEVCTKHPNKNVFVLFDEADSIGSRAGANSENNAAIADGNLKIINELLKLVDDKPKNCFIMFATNYSHKMDSALVRPGRISLRKKFDYPSNNDIEMIVKSSFKNCSAKYVSSEIIQYISQKFIKHNEAIEKSIKTFVVGNDKIDANKYRKLSVATITNFCNQILQDLAYSIEQEKNHDPITKKFVDTLFDEDENLLIENTKADVYEEFAVR